MILGIDVGGTHTDAVLIDHFAVLKKAKVLMDERNGAGLNPMKGAAS